MFTGDPEFRVDEDRFYWQSFHAIKISDSEGHIVEVITSFVSKDRDQWALVGLKTETKVIFCLYASGIGLGSINSQAIVSE